MGDDQEAVNRFRSPALLLFSYSAELAIKAFLLHRGLTPARLKKYGHQLGSLFDEACVRGLPRAADDMTNLGNVLSLLEGANYDGLLRYFRLRSMTVPELPWVQQSVSELLARVVKEIGYAPNGAPGPAAMLILTVQKPTPLPTASRAATHEALPD